MASRSSTCHRAHLVVGGVGGSGPHADRHRERGCRSALSWHPGGDDGGCLPSVAACHSTQRQRSAQVCGPAGMADCTRGRLPTPSRCIEIGCEQTVMTSCTPCVTRASTSGRSFSALTGLDAALSATCSLASCGKLNLTAHQTALLAMHACMSPCTPAVPAATKLLRNLDTAAVRSPALPCPDPPCC